VKKRKGRKVEIKVSLYMSFENRERGSCNVPNT
jgi:hypothetical protein